MAPYQSRIFLTINVVAAIAMGILFYFVHNQGVTIQHERRASIMRSCQDQNKRRVHTINILDREIAQLPPAQRARAKASRDFTILLINALAPKQNCEKLVATAVHS